MSTTVTNINLTTIRAVAQFIADRFDPEQVILFGSYARGEGRTQRCRSAGNTAQRR
jgi:predicted nucleotidyltransferase